MEKSVKIPDSFILDRYSPYAFSSKSVPEEELEPVAMFVLGYPGKIEKFPPEIRKLELRERTREPLKEIVRRGKFEA